MQDLIDWYKQAVESDRDHRAERTAWAFGRYALDPGLVYEK